MDTSPSNPSEQGIASLCKDRRITISRANPVRPDAKRFGSLWIGNRAQPLTHIEALELDEVPVVDTLGSNLPRRMS